MKSIIKLSVLALATFLFLSQASSALEKKKSEEPIKITAPEPQKDVAQAVASFKAACEKLLKKDKKVKNAGLRCGCVGENLATKLKIAEINLLTKVYQGDEAAENELEKDENLPVQDFELEISQNCLANPKWKVTK